MMKTRKRFSTKELFSTRESNAGIHEEVTHGVITLEELQQYAARIRQINEEMCRRGYTIIRQHNPYSFAGTGYSIFGVSSTYADKNLTTEEEVNSLYAQ